MPQIGEVTKGNNRLRIYSKTYIACPICKKTRWVDTQSLRNQEKRGIPKGRCLACATRNYMLNLPTEKHPSWRGGRAKGPNGYIQVKLRVNSPLYAMANKQGYVPEHRLVMAQYLGHCLKLEEIVHHLNGIKDDNRIENLALLYRHNHSSWTLLYMMWERIRELEKFATENEEIQEKLLTEEREEEELPDF